jgi:hypothetical protein
MHDLWSIVFASRLSNRSSALCGHRQLALIPAPDLGSQRNRNARDFALIVSVTTFHLLPRSTNICCSGHVIYWCVEVRMQDKKGTRTALWESCDTYISRSDYRYRGCTYKEKARRRHETKESKRGSRRGRCVQDFKAHR